MFSRGRRDADWPRRRYYPTRLPLLETPELSPIPEWVAPRAHTSEDDELPALVIEADPKPRKRRQDDESEEFYDQLAKRMRKYYRKIFNVPKTQKHRNKEVNSDEDSSSDITDMQFLDPSFVTESQTHFDDIEEDINVLENEEYQNVVVSEYQEENLENIRWRTRLTQVTTSQDTAEGRDPTFEKNRALSQTANISQNLSETFTVNDDRPDANNNLESGSFVKPRETGVSSIDTSSIEESGVQNIVVHAMVHDPPRRFTYPRRSTIFEFDPRHTSSFDTTPSALNRATIISDDMSASARSSDSVRSNDTTVILSSSNDEDENQVRREPDKEGSYVFTLNKTAKSSQKNKKTDSSESSSKTDSSRSHGSKNITVRQKPTHISIRKSSFEVEDEAEQQAVKDNVTVRKRLRYTSPVRTQSEDGIEDQPNVTNEEAIGDGEEAAIEKRQEQDKSEMSTEHINNTAKEDSEGSEHCSQALTPRSEQNRSARRIITPGPDYSSQPASPRREHDRSAGRSIISATPNKRSSGSAATVADTSRLTTSERVEQEESYSRGGEAEGSHETEVDEEIEEQSLQEELCLGADSATPNKRSSGSAVTDAGGSQTVVEEEIEEQSLQEELCHGADSDSSDTAGNSFRGFESDERLETITEIDEPVSVLTEKNQDENEAMDIESEKEVEVMRRHEPVQAKHSLEAVVTRKYTDIFKSPELLKRKHSILDLQLTMTPVENSSQNEDFQLLKETPQNPTRKRASSLFEFTDSSKRSRLDSIERDVQKRHVFTQTEKDRRDKRSKSPIKNAGTQTRSITKDAAAQTEEDGRPEGVDRGTQTEQQDESYRNFYGEGAFRLWCWFR